MKKIFASILASSVALSLLTGCVIGSRIIVSTPPQVTLNQQLLDLQKAKAADVITDAEYQKEKQKVLDDKVEAGSETIGQQLLDLKKLNDSGVITAPEYQAQKKKVLECK